MESVSGSFILMRMRRRQRRIMTVERKNLRDVQNPLEISEERFIELYRLPKSLFIDTLNQLSPFFRMSTRNTAIPVHLKMLSALRFFATGSYQRVIGHDFLSCLSQTTVSRCVEEVTNVLNTVQSAYVHFPNETEEPGIKAEFYQKYGFPGIIGLMDGTHIKIAAPKGSLESAYYCRKGGHSINLILICDSKYQISYANAKFPGTSHDAYIWRCSAMQNYLKEKFMRGQRNHWLLGDSGFPLQPWLMTPFNAPSNDAEEKFNIAHKKTRCIVERCIGILKSRFRCLSRHRSLCYEPGKAGKIINACIVLHNILIKANVAVPEAIEPDIELDDSFQETVELAQNTLQSRARTTRQQIVETYFN